MKSELEIDMENSGIKELPSSIFQYRTHTTKLYLRSLENLVTLPNSICMLKSLKFLYQQGCSELESLPEEIGDMENLEEFDASFTLIYRPPSSIVGLNKLKKLNFAKGELEEREATVHFVFPRVKEGLRSLEELDLSYCNLIDGQLLEDIGCLSSLKELYLKGNNFDHLPQSIVQLGTLQVLDVSNCERLIELPELPPNVEELWADNHVGPRIQKYENMNFVVFGTMNAAYDDISDLFAQILLKCILSLRKSLSPSDFLSQRVFNMWHPSTRIPDWFKYHNEPGMDLLVKLPEDWYANGNFLGFAICHCGWLYESTVELLPLSNDDNSEKLSKNLAVQPSFKYFKGVNFYFIPFASLWDPSMTNGKTPNAYGHLKFSVTYREVSGFGFRLLYKDEPELENLLERRENSANKLSFVLTTVNAYDSVTNEASCSLVSNKGLVLISVVVSDVENLQQQIEGPITSGTLKFFLENPGFIT